MMYYARSHFYCRCICAVFREGEGFQTSYRWSLLFFPTGYVIFCQLASHRLPPWSHCRLKWLPYQRPWHVATEKPQERPRTWCALSTTYAKVRQLSVKWTSLARGISFWNRLHKWRAHSVLGTGFSAEYLYDQAASISVCPTVPDCWACCRCCMYMLLC